MKTDENKDVPNNNNPYESINLNEESLNLIKKTHLYPGIINKLSFHHYIAMVLYVLCLMGLSFLIFELNIIIKVIGGIFFLKQYLLSGLIALNFFGITVGLLINIYFITYSTRIKVVFCSLVTFFILVLNVLGSSLEVFYFSHPFISIFFSISFFSVKNHFEEYFMGSDFKLYRAFTLGLFPLCFFFVWINFAFFRHEKWEVYFVCFASVNMFLFIFAGLFLSDSPQILNINNGNDYLMNILENVKENEISEEEKITLVSDITSFVHNENQIKFSDLLNESRKKFTLLFMFLVTTVSYNNVPCLILTVSLLYDFHQMSALINYFYMVMICMVGGVVGVCIAVFTNFHKKATIIIHYSLIFVFGILTSFYVKNIDIFGGLILFFGFSLNSQISLLHPDYVEPAYLRKFKISFDVVFYGSAFIWVLVIGSLYIINAKLAIISFCVNAIAGILLTVFLNK